MSIEDGSKRLNGKVCIIAGASSGMGRWTALMAGAQGATTLVAARRIGACEQVVKEIKDNGGDAAAFALDATDPQSVEGVFGAIKERYGRLDGAYNNLGSIIGNAPIHEISLEQWNDSLAVNLTAIFLLMRQEIPLLKAAGGGAIVNNSSSAGLRGERMMADYAAAKWGLIGLTQTAALEYGKDNIRVNVIAPGIIRTEKADALAGEMPDLFEKLRERIPLQRFGEMSDVGAVVTWLLSDEARYLSGATLRIDAAQTAGADILR